jgi:ubiquinone/menaquinone biosynthesis C-methylase UbiE
VEIGYDGFAAEYNADNESNLLNAYYERPAMLDLAGNVTGRDVLDIGCGAGPLAERLVQRGARVSGFDSSVRMIDLARKRLGDGVNLQVADLAEPLPYGDDSFDVACASLVLHYLADWADSLTEIKRVLRPGGRLVASINHPLLFALMEQRYFGIEQYEYTHTFDGREATLTMWHHTLDDISQAISRSGLRLVSLQKPSVADDTPAELLDEPGKRRFISFLFIVMANPSDTIVS